MISRISEIAKSDPGFVRLLGMAREYADIYLLAQKRQKGCDGMGELAMVKEEFRDSLEVLIKYCVGRKYLSGDVRYELDSVADEFEELSMGESASGSGQE